MDRQARAVEVYRLREGVIEPDVRGDRVVWQPVAHARVLQLEVQKLSQVDAITSRQQRRFRWWSWVL